MTPLQIRGCSGKCVIAMLSGLWIAVQGCPGWADDSVTGTLLYSRLTEGTWQVWQTDLINGHSTQVTWSPGDKRYPAWTPDGRVSYCTSNQMCLVTRWDGQESESVFTAWQPLRDLVWSPDGRRLAFAKFRTDVVDSANLWVADAAGTAPHMLTQDIGIQYHPVWSPDGRHLAYAAGHGYGTYELYVIDADGANRRRLTHNSSHEFLPAWSPDGQHIAFSSDASGDYEIWVVHADGQGARPLTHSAGLDTRPAWSPDSRRLAFATHRSGRLEIWVMEADGSQPRLLEQGTEGACDPAWRSR